jgi:phosphoribosylformimino-5-aminoimidazole carboxamide ribotide isomerase
MMLAIPAIDIMGGKCVRLAGGDPGTAKAYGEPVEWAARWIELGARRLHVVDLDGAFSGAPVALDLLGQICSLAKDVEVQFGGGLRSFGAITAAFRRGARFAILGSAATEPGLLRTLVRSFGDRVMLAVDIRNGKTAVRGWTQAGGDVASTVRHALYCGVRTAVVTSVKRDGSLEGPDLDVASDVASLGIDVIVSGGIGSSCDLYAIASTGNRRFSGAILGKALYEGRISLPEAIRVLSLEPYSPKK